MNDEGVVALLGLALMTIEGREIRVPAEILERGLPADSGVQVFRDEMADELVIRIEKYEEKKETDEH